MGFVMGTGRARAARPAAEAARAGLGSELPSFALVFAAPDHSLAEVARAVREVMVGAPVLACTTGGEFTESGWGHGQIVVTALSGDPLTVAEAYGEGLSGDTEGLARTLCAGYAEARAAAAKARCVHATTMLLTDGLQTTGERLVRALSLHSSAFQQIVGGAAGDEGRRRRTVVAAAGEAGSDAAACLHLFTSAPIGVGVGHGLTRSSETMQATRVEGTVIWEIDGRPAAEVYGERLASRGVALPGPSEIPNFVGNELGVYFLDTVRRARAVLRIVPGGGIECAAEIPNYARLCFLDSEPDRLIHAVREAAREARKNLGGAEPAGAMLFDCVTREAILGDAFPKEIEAIREVLGDIPVSGFLTYGEIARYRGKLDGWHNTTAVIVAFPR